MPPPSWASATTPSAAGSRTASLDGQQRRVGSQGGRRLRAGPVRAQARATAAPNPCGVGELGPQPVRRAGHRHQARHRHGAGRAAVRPVPGGVADEQRGGARPRPRARLGRRRGGEVHDGHRRNPRRRCHEALAHARPPCPAAGTAPRPAACGRRLRDGWRRSRDGAKTSLTVFAAASLTSTFDRARRAVRGRPRGREGQLNFAGSADLVAQIQQGAPADVFASADTKNMDKADRRRSRRRRAGRLRDQHARDRGAPGQPRRRRSPSQDLAKPGTEARHVRAGGAVRCGGRRRSSRRRRGRRSSRSARSSP